MKVYIVTEGEYSDYHIEEVFSEREQAEKYVALHNKRYDKYHIAAYEVDKVHIEGEVEMVHMYQALYQRKEGKWQYSTELIDFITSKETAESIKDEEISYFVEDFHRGSMDYSVFLKETDYDKALKIFQDHLAELTAKEQAII
jgi:hypothetical protein